MNENIEDNKNVYNLDLKDLEGEIWKDVVGYEDEYRVSNLGRVKNKERFITHYATKTGVRILKSRIRKLSLNDNGYHHVRLSKNNKSETLLVHRLVAKMFLYNPNNYSDVNHKNLNKIDNRIENLEWISKTLNTRHWMNKRRIFKVYGSPKYISTENIYKVKNVDNEEIWIDIPDYVNLYKISSYGRILSLAKQGFDGRFLTEKILKCSNDKNGYKLVFLYKNGKKKVFKVHRLIAILFIENNKNLPCVNHRDNDKKNNHVKNLEWVNDKMNKAHAISLNLMPKGESVFGSKLNKEDVIKIRNLYYQNKLSQQNIADMFNIQPTTVSGIIRGRIWRHI